MLRLISLDRVIAAGFGQGTWGARWANLHSIPSRYQVRRRDLRLSMGRATEVGAAEARSGGMAAALAQCECPATGLHPDANGWPMLRGVLTKSECAMLAAMYADAAHVTQARDLQCLGFGRGESSGTRMVSYFTMPRSED